MMNEHEKRPVTLPSQECKDLSLEVIPVSSCGKRDMTRDDTVLSTFASSSTAGSNEIMPRGAPDNQM